MKEEVDKYVRIAAANFEKDDRNPLVLLLLDADDDCAAALGPPLKAMAAESLPQVRVECVLAVREFEAWFLAGGCVGLLEDDTEKIRDAKGLLRDHRGTYSPTADQAGLAATMNLELARQSPSFRKLLRALGVVAES